MRPDTHIIYLIATCERFFERTMPSILAQLAAEAIPPERIKVVVNGSKSNASRTVDGIDYAFTTPRCVGVVCPL